MPFSILSTTRAMNGAHDQDFTDLSKHLAALRAIAPLLDQQPGEVQDAGRRVAHTLSLIHI